MEDLWGKNNYGISFLTHLYIEHRGDARCFYDPSLFLGIRLDSPSIKSPVWQVRKLDPKGILLSGGTLYECNLAMTKGNLTSKYICWYIYIFTYSTIIVYSQLSTIQYQLIYVLYIYTHNSWLYIKNDSGTKRRSRGMHVCQPSTMIAASLNHFSLWYCRHKSGWVFSLEYQRVEPFSIPNPDISLAFNSPTKIE